MKNIIFLLVLCSLLYAGDLDRVGTSTLWVTQGYVFESISGTGFTKSIYSHVANLSSTNPAAMYAGDNIYMGISYQLESVIKPAWVANISHERGHPYLPQSLGIVYPLRSFRIGIGFSQRYNSFLDLGKFEITTVENPDGTGEFWTADKNKLVICYSGFLSYSMTNLQRTTDELCLGIQLNYNTLDFTERMYRLEAKGQGRAIGWAVGVRYDLADKFQIGLFYERNPDFNEKIKVDNGSTGIGRDTSIVISRFRSKLPDKLNVGVLYRISKSMEMTLEITNIYWHQSSDESLNSFDISGSLLGHLSENISLSVGILSTERRYDKQSDYYSTVNDNLDGLFMLAGVNLCYGVFDFDLALVTAVVYGEWRKQSIGKFALGYQL